MLFIYVIFHDIPYTVIVATNISRLYHRFIIGMKIESQIESMYNKIIKFYELNFNLAEFE